MPNGVVFNVSVAFDQMMLRHELKANAKKAQWILDNAIISDTGPYVPFDHGTLFGSVKLASDIGGGEIVYNTPYARRLYYGLSFKFQHKPGHQLACSQWFEASKAVNGKRWIAEVERILKGGNGR